jgi:hypothetical protein
LRPIEDRRTRPEHLISSILYGSCWPWKPEREMIVAVLHDVVEDGGIALDDLRKDGYSEEIIEAVDHLTHRDGEEYDQFIDRVNGNPLAVKVKIADLKDNSNLGRIAEPNENDCKHLEKYQRALRKLMSETPEN